MSGTLAAVMALAVGASRAGRRALVRSTFDLAADFGMKKLGASAAEDLLEIFVRRYEAGSTLITTNHPTQDWGAFRGGVPAANKKH